MNPLQQLNYQNLEAMLKLVSPDARGMGLLKQGWPDGRKLALQQHKKIWDAVAAESFSLTLRHDTSGFEVDLSRYLAGEPECMLETKEAPADTFVDIWVSLSISGMVGQDYIFRRGSAILALIDGLEHGNKRVSLTVCLSGDSGAWTTIIKVKDYDQRLYIDQLAVILCHESFLRGILFSLWDNVKGNSGNKYTRPCLTSHPEGCIYVGHMLGTDSQWSTLESCQKWVLEEMKKQKVSIGE